MSTTKLEYDIINTLKGSDNMDRFKSAKIASILGIALNAFLLIIKGITGFLTNSQAMIADAFNSASDIFSSVMTYVGNRVASKPRDADHNLGHGKAEYVFSMLISITMFLLSIKVLSSSFKSLLYGSEYNFSIWVIVVCVVIIVGLLTLIGLSLTGVLGTKEPSDNNVIDKDEGINDSYCA